MRRWGLVWVVLLVILGLSLPKLIACTEFMDTPHAEVEDDDFWEDIEDDEEPKGGSTASKSRPQNTLVQLNDQNAERILQSNEYVLVLGYASWCRQSAAVMVDFTEAASVLFSKGSPVVLAKVDAVVNTITAGRYNIKGFPTVLFFRNGSDSIYPSGLTSDEIVNWVQKQTGHPATTVSSSEEAEAIQSRNKTLVIGMFDEFEGSEYEEFVAASIKVSDIEFLQTTVAEAAKVFSLEMVDRVPSIGLWKSDEGFVKMEMGGPLKQENVAAFVNLNKYASITQLHGQNVGKIYSSPVKKQVILFTNREEFSKLQSFYRVVAQSFKSALMFVWVDNADEDFAKPMLTMYGIPDDEPVVAGFDNNNGLRYLLDAEVTEQNLVSFAEKFAQDKLELHYKSERIPKENNGDVKVVVGKTFGSLVLQSPTDVVLQVYTPYCYDCEAMGKAFVKLAKHFKGDSSLIFAKIDASANEHRALKVVSYPAILFYSANSGSKEPVVGNIQPYLKKLVKFVEKQVQSRSAVESDLNQAENIETLTEIPDVRNAEGLKVTDPESGSTGAVLEVPVLTEIEIEPGVEMETPVVSPTPTEATVADVSRIAHRADDEDTEVGDSKIGRTSHKDEL